MQPPLGELTFVESHDGGRIRVFDSGGDGDVVLLAHGYLLDLTIWDLVAAPLIAAGYRVLAFDQRGHAQSESGEPCTAVAAARDYRTLLEHFDVRNGTLVAHSMGGFLALLFCLENPGVAKRLQRLVLLGANAGAVARGSLQNQLQIPLLRAGLIPYAWRLPPLGRALMRPLFGRAADPDFVEATRQVIAKQDVQRSLPLLRAMCFEDYYARLHEIPIETTVLCGDLDQTCPPWHSRELGAKLQRATSRPLPGMGHMLMYEAPQPVIDAVCEPASQRSAGDQPPERVIRPEY